MVKQQNLLRYFLVYLQIESTISVQWHSIESDLNFGFHESPSQLFGFSILFINVVQHFKTIYNAKSVNNNLFINFRKLFLLDPSNVNFIYSENEKKSKGSKKLNILSYHNPFQRNGSRGFFLRVKEIKLHLQDPGQRYIDTEINFNIFIGLSNSSTYFNFNKCFIVQKSIFGSFAINKYTSDLRRNRYL